MKAGHICTCKSFVQRKLECNVNKVRGWVFSSFLFNFFLFEWFGGEMEPNGFKTNSLLPASLLQPLKSHHLHHHLFSRSQKEPGPALTAWPTSSGPGHSTSGQPSPCLLHPCPTKVEKTNL